MPSVRSNLTNPIMRNHVGAMLQLMEPTLLEPPIVQLPPETQAIDNSSEKQTQV